jgi:hypothetical protein
MRFPRAPLTVRRVLVAVAWIAVLLAVSGPILRRWDYCLKMAASHAEAEARARAAMRSHRSAIGAAPRHAELRSTYQRVAPAPGNRSRTIRSFLIRRVAAPVRSLTTRVQPTSAPTNDQRTGDGEDRDPPRQRHARRCRGYNHGDPGVPRGHVTFRQRCSGRKGLSP